TALLERLRAEHPTDRNHLAAHDERLLDVFTEAEAYAWAAETAALDSPHWIFDQGCPDLRAGETWVEANAVKESLEEREEQRKLMPYLERYGIVSRGARSLGPLPEQVIKKMEEKLADSEKK